MLVYKVPKQIPNIEVRHPTDGLIKATVEIHTRGGYDSPELMLVLYKGRRITPFEFHRKGWEMPLNSLFKMIYSDHMKELVECANPFMRIVSKDSDLGRLYHTPVILGIEHGVTFDKT